MPNSIAGLFDDDNRACLQGCGSGGQDGIEPANDVQPRRQRQPQQYDTDNQPAGEGDNLGKVQIERDENASLLGGQIEEISIRGTSESDVANVDCIMTLDAKVICRVRREAGIEQELHGG